MQGIASATPEELADKLTALAGDAAKPDEDKIKEACDLLKKDEASMEKAVELLKSKYDEGRGFFEEEKWTTAGRGLCLFGIATLKNGSITVFGSIRLILWNGIYDLAANSVLPQEEKQKAGVELVRVWKLLIDNLYSEVKNQHGKHEAEGNQEAMSRDLSQMELIAAAVEEALSRKDLKEDVEAFKKAIKELEEMKPEDREKVKRGDDALKRAIHKYEGLEYAPARDVFKLAYDIFKEVGAKRKMMFAAYWLAVVHEKLKEFWEIKGFLEEAIKLAEELGDTSKVKEMKEYQESLKTKEKEGEFTLIKSPLSDPANFGKAEPVVKLNTRYGNPVPTPDPRRFADIMFWKNIYIADGEYQGKPADKVKLPFPGILYWIKKGDQIIFANNDEGKGGKPIKLGLKPSKQSVTCEYYHKGDSLKLRYDFQACLYRQVKVCERTIEYPADNIAYNIRIVSDTFRAGTFKGQDFVISDDNGNGVFSDFGTEENPAAEHKFDMKFESADGMFAGKGSSGYSTILGSLVKIGDAYFDLELNESATEVTFKEYKGPTGKVSVDFKGNPRAIVKHFIIGQKVGESKIFFVNLGETKGPVDVPVGAYFFKFALITSHPDPEKGFRIEVHRGDFPGFKVEEKQTLTLEFGAPFKFNYPVTFDPNSGDGTIATYNMTITGSKGEIYKRYWPKVFAPEYMIKDSVGKTVVKAKMRAFEETDELQPAGVGAELLYMQPLYVKFKAKAGVHVPPFRVVISDSGPLFGVVKDPDYR